MEEQNIVKRVCKELGITQKELAEKIGVAEQTVRNWSSKGDVPEWAIKFADTLLELESLKTKDKEDNTLEVLKQFKNLLNNI